MLARHPDHIDNTVLAQFPEFQEFLSRAKTTASPPGEGGGGLAEPQTTPEEAIDVAQRELRAALAEEVLGRVLNKPAEFFETVVLDVLLDDSPEAYWRFAEEYYELASMDLEAVREIYALRPLTQPWSPPSTASYRWRIWPTTSLRSGTQQLSRNGNHRTFRAAHKQVRLEY